MVDEVRGADRQARVAGGGLHVNLLKRRAIEDLAVGHAVEGHTARQAHRLLACARMQRVEQLKQNLLEPRLHGRRQIAMALLDRLTGSAAGPQALLHVLGEYPSELGGLVGFTPGHVGAGAVVREVLQAEAEALRAAALQDAAKLLEIRGL